VRCTVAVHPVSFVSKNLLLLSITAASYADTMCLQDSEPRIGSAYAAADAASLFAAHPARLALVPHSVALQGLLSLDLGVCSPGICLTHLTQLTALRTDKLFSLESGGNIRV
jgi:hypothetical protein